MMTGVLMLVGLVGGALFVGALIIGVLVVIPMLWDMMTGTGPDEDREQVGLGCAILVLILSVVGGIVQLATRSGQGH
jgi:hypothetical protein